MPFKYPIAYTIDGIVYGKFYGKNDLKTTKLESKYEWKKSQYADTCPFTPFWFYNYY